MALESSVQWWLHTFEQGALARWVIRGLIAIALSALALYWMLGKFNGFYIPEAMDQAQIGRQIATGRGFTTLYARPLTLNVLLGRGKLREPLPEVNNAPLGPLIDAVVLRVTGTAAVAPPGVFVPPGDRAIAAAGMVFLAGALFTGYRLGCALFGRRLALPGAGLLACTALLWRFAASGLPQMAMLVLFNASLLALLTAMRSTASGQRRRALWLVGLAAFLLGLATLGHGLMLWVAPGFFLYTAAVVRPGLRGMAGAAVAWVLPLLPWVWHNWRALRDPFGMAWIEWQRPTGMDPLAFAADLEPRFGFHWADFMTNTASQALSQAADLPVLLGSNPVAFAFFLAVLFLPFTTWWAAQFRWAVLLMWLGAFAGMAVAGVNTELSSNQLHVLFLPVMTFYGLAFLLSLWDRLGWETPLLRATFLVVIYAVVSLPLLVSLGARGMRVNWPPYIPLLIQQFADFIEPSEAMGSDIPWATAWYAGRRSVLLPRTVEQFHLINSENLLGAPIVAVYLTPASGDLPAFSDIVHGRYQDWARLIFRETGARPTPAWPLGFRVVLPIDGGSLLFADKPRWEQ